MTPQEERELRVQIELAKARARTKPQQNPQTVTGAASAVATGLRNAAEGIPGALGGIPELAGQGIGWAGGQLHNLGTRVFGGEKVDPSEQATLVGEEARKNASPIGTIITALERYGILQPDTAETSREIVSPTPADIASVTNPIVEKISPAVQEFTRHTPANQFERLLQTTGEFAPAALSPGSALQKIARVAVPTAGAETAAAAAPEGYEDVARMVAGLILGGAQESTIKGFRNRSALRQVGATKGATERVMQLLREQGMSEADALARMRELGVGRAALVDVGAEEGNLLRHEAQQVQAAGGEGRSFLDSMLRAREANKNRRLLEEAGATVGPREQPGAVTAALESRLSEAARKQREAHPAQAKPVAAQSIVDDIDSKLGVEKSPKIRSTLQRVRDSLHLRGTDELDPSSEGLLSARQAISDELYSADGRTIKESLGPKEKQLLQDYYAQINRAMDEANPTLREADTEIAQAGKEQRAFQQGQELYENPRGAPTEVEFAETWEGLSPGEREHIAKGLNVETYRQLGIKGNNLVELEKLIRGEGKWNFEKVATVVGRDKAQRLMDAISREKVFNESYRKIVQGSKTAESAPKQKTGLMRSLASGVPEMAAGLAMGSPSAAAGSAVSIVRRFLQDRIASSGAGQPSGLGRMLASTNPDELMRAFELVKQAGWKQSTTMPQALISALLARQEEQGQ